MYSRALRATFVPMNERRYVRLLVSERVADFASNESEPLPRPPVDIAHVLPAVLDDTAIGIVDLSIVTLHPRT